MYFHIHIQGTGRERLIRTRLIRSTTLFEVSLKSLADPISSYLK